MLNAFLLATSVMISAPVAQDQMAPAQAAPAQTAPAQAAPAKQPASPQQIAQLIDRDFANYDKNGDGVLKQEEFSGWMVALRSATEPAFTGESAADKEWLGQALTAADGDKSGGVTASELKMFLAPAGAS